MTEKLLHALTELDHSNDDQWTQGDQPKLEVLSAMVGERVTREAVLAVDPLFAREPDKVKPAEVEKKDPLDDLRVNLEAAQAALAERMSERNVENRKVMDAQRAMDEAIVALESKEDPRVTALRRTKALIAQSNKDRMDRAVLMEDRRKREPADPRSPLDRALNSRPRNR